jgi:hypothetical protein
MNLQPLFDEIVAHLRKQNARSLNVSQLTGASGCAYRGDNGLTCAVGCLIPDELYSPFIEGSSASVFTKAVVADGYKYKNATDEIRQSFKKIGRVLTKKAGLNSKVHRYDAQLLGDFLNSFQVIHDKAPVENWEDRFQLLARRHNLHYTEPAETV